jgi:hypothetical protein
VTVHHHLRGLIDARRLAVTACLAAACVTRMVEAQRPDAAPTSRADARPVVGDTLGSGTDGGSLAPVMLAGVAVAAAAGAQVVASPTAWPRTAGGYARRLGDQVGFIVVEESLRAGVQRLTGLRPDTRPCPRDARRIVPCAAARVFGARTDDGRTRPALPLLAGIVGGTAASLAWRPEGRRGGGDALAFVGTRLAIGFGAPVLARVVRDWRRPGAPP